MKIFDNIQQYMDNHNVGEKIVFLENGKKIVDIKPYEIYIMQKQARPHYRIAVKPIIGRVGRIIPKRCYNKKVVVLSETMYNGLKD